MEAKLFEGHWFSYFLKYENGYKDDSDEYQCHYLEIIDHVYSQKNPSNISCHYIQNDYQLHYLGLTNCSGDEEIKAKKLENAYNQFLDDLGVNRVENKF